MYHWKQSSHPLDQGKSISRLHNHTLMDSFTRSHSTHIIGIQRFPLRNRKTSATFYPTRKLHFLPAAGVRNTVLVHRAARSSKGARGAKSRAIPDQTVTPAYTAITITSRPLTLFRKPLLNRVLHSDIERLQRIGKGVGIGILPQLRRMPRRKRHDEQIPRPVRNRPYAQLRVSHFQPQYLHFLPRSLPAFPSRVFCAHPRTRPVVNENFSFPQCLV